MFNPISTYRLQFHKDFTLGNFKEVIPYLQELGIVTIYASPILHAAPGSTHGYNGISPHRINPEIGTEDELKEISKILHEYQIGWVQDIAPNHMAFHKDNAWLVDVLLNGKASAYAAYFDIIWDSPLYDGRIMVPFQGSELETLLKEKDPGETHYKICHWQETDKQINYRRFFTVNDLICLNIQTKEVFDSYHSYIKTLQDAGVFQGLRIDHIDGLYDPTAYLENIRSLAGNECYIVVEKILEPGETIPGQWPIQGNTGYDFLAMVNNLLTRASSRKDFKDFYEILIEDKRSIEEQTTEKKAYMLDHHMQGELENLYRLFYSLSLANEDNETATAAEIKEAIGHMLIQCPVYRYYGNSLPLDDNEAKAIEEIFNNITVHHQHLAPAVKVLSNTILRKPLEGDKDYNKRAAHFYQRCMQFSGPLMAKGVEDTLMYTYNSFVGHNEVGDSPLSFGLDPETFHAAMQYRAGESPLSMNATATHDTKRGEDVRARLNVLTDLKDEWLQVVESWYQLNTDLQGNGAPDINDEYFIYQALTGTYPMPGQSDDGFRERLEEYLTKALREAKRKSDWANPDEAYESATSSFIGRLLDKGRPFWKSFIAFHHKIADAGIINSLTQTILKFTCPGIPDTYQGCELWDLSFVDPDNRRPVDYALRAKWLNDIKNDEHNAAGLAEQLWTNRFDGRIKLWITHLLLKERRQRSRVYTEGAYIPLSVTGEYSHHILAFARYNENKWTTVVVPVNIASLSKLQQQEVCLLAWGDTRIILPEHAPQKWRHLLSGKDVDVREGLLVKEVFYGLPFVILSA